MRTRGRALSRRYGHAQHMDKDYFRRVAETFLHPIAVRAFDGKAPNQEDRQELAELLERVADRGRAGR